MPTNWQNRLKNIIDKYDNLPKSVKDRLVDLSSGIKNHSQYYTFLNRVDTINNKYGIVDTILNEKTINNDKLNYGCKLGSCLYCQTICDNYMKG